MMAAPLYLNIDYIIYDLKHTAETVHLLTRRCPFGVLGLQFTPRSLPLNIWRHLYFVLEADPTITAACSCSVQCSGGSWVDFVAIATHDRKWKLFQFNAEKKIWKRNIWHDNEGIMMQACFWRYLGLLVLSVHCCSAALTTASVYFNGWANKISYGIYFLQSRAQNFDGLTSDASIPCF